MPSAQALEKTNRFLYIDGLRGVASFAVAWFHISMHMSWPAWSLCYPLLLISAWGRFGVQIFFVISGFVIAHTLYKGNPIRSFKATGLFFVRRSLRLDPTYWVCLPVGLVSNWIYCNYTSHPTPGITAEVSWFRIWTNALYLQKILSSPPILDVAWTLCVEIQLYIAFAILLLLSNLISAKWKTDVATVRTVVFFLCVLFSWAWPLGLLPYIDGWLLPHCYLFLLGVFCCWCYHRQRYAKGLFLFAVFLTVVSLGVQYLTKSKDDPSYVGSYMFVGLLTAVSLYLAPSVKPLMRILSLGPLLYLGRLSYCLYLLHVPIGVLFVSLIGTYYDIGHSLPWCFVAVLAGVGLTMLASQLLYSLVELPTLELSRRIRYGAPAPEVPCGTSETSAPASASPTSAAQLPGLWSDDGVVKSGSSETPAAIPAVPLPTQASPSSVP
jgi:peptidoglycan/LPS O-acetylase OafA/YrhL